MKSKFKQKDDLFLNQLKQVMNSFNKNVQPISNFNNGEQSLRLISKLKESINKKKIISLS